VLKYVAVWFIELQCAVVCCKSRDFNQKDMTCTFSGFMESCRMLQCVRCIAVCRSVLQCVAV